MRTLNLLFLIVQDRCIHFSILYSYLLWHFWWCNDVCLNNIQHFSQTIMDWIIKGSIENLIFKSKKLRLRRVDMRWRSLIDIDRESDNFFIDTVQHQKFIQVLFITGQDIDLVRMDIFSSFYFGFDSIFYKLSGLCKIRYIVSQI